MPVVVTRPRAEGERWRARLAEHGIAGIVLPLLEIGPPPDRAAMQAAARAADHYAAVMFVSANAVEGFFSAAPQFRQARAWAPGPATADALVAAGVEAQRICAPAADAPQFDSEALWAQVRHQVGAGERVLIVRGADADGASRGREWLAQQLATHGLQVDTVAAYARRAPAWTRPEREAAAQAAVDGSLWLFSSSEAAGHLPALLPGQDFSRAAALATHPRIAQAVRALGFGSVQACRPGFADVLASIESRR